MEVSPSRQWCSADMLVVDAAADTGAAAGGSLPCQTELFRFRLRAGSNHCAVATANTNTNQDARSHSRRSKAKGVLNNNFRFCQSSH